MFGSFDRPILGRALRKLGKQTEWISWLVYGIWLGKYFFAHDPTGLVVGFAAFVLIQIGGVVCKLLADKYEEVKEPTDGNHATEGGGEEESRDAGHDRRR